jgi:phage tail sheath gpL-like
MPTPAIAPVGLTSGEVLPGIYIEVNFAQGPAIGSGLTRAILVLANRTTDGTATVDTEIYGPDTPVQLQTEAQMILLGGPGSEAHRMFRRMAAITLGQGGPPVYWLFVTESAGAKATGTVTIATNATGVATHRLYVGDEFVDTPIDTGDTPTQIAVKIVAKVNAQTHWAVVATNSAGVVTLTAKQKGLRGNWIRYQAQIITPVSIATTTTATTDAFFTGGTTADSNTTALATIAARWYYHIVSAAEDATQLGAAASQVASQALALTGLRQRLFGGSIDTSSNANSVAVGINNPLVEIIHEEKSPWTPAELAANAAMVYALEEASELGFRTNFIGYGNDAQTKPLWKVPPSRVASAAPSQATLRSLLQNGVTPIATNTNGTTYLVDRFTTRSLNGSQPDPRIREAHKVTIAHRFADAIERRLRVAGAGKTIDDDPPNNAPPIPGTITPRLCRIPLHQTLDEFAINAKIQRGVDPNTGVDRLTQQKEGSVVQREANPTSRMGIRVPLQTIDNFRQAAVIVDQVA